VSFSKDECEVLSPGGRPPLQQPRRGSRSAGTAHPGQPAASRVDREAAVGLGEGIVPRSSALVGPQ